MSKSKGNVIDPKLLIERYGSDAIRYFLLREVPFGQDGVFTPDALVQRLNFDLANDFGNLVHRTAAMINRFVDGVVPTPSDVEAIDEDIRKLAQQTVLNVNQHMDEMQFSIALTDIWKLVRQANKYIDETAPWSLNKSGNQRRLQTVLYNMAETVRYITVLIQPFMTKAPQAIETQYGFTPEQMTWESLEKFGQLKPGVRVQQGNPLFPRLDMEQELGALENLTGTKTQASAVEAKAAEMQKKPSKESKTAMEQTGTAKEQIGIDVFGQVELKVGQVKVCDRVPDADKLLRLEIDLGTEVRQIVSGIAKYYSPEELVGKKVVVVTNLKPVKLRGVESNGMILAASEGNQLSVVTVPDSMPNGAIVK